MKIKGKIPKLRIYSIVRLLEGKETFAKHLENTKVFAVLRESK